MRNHCNYITILAGPCIFPLSRHTQLHLAHRYILTAPNADFELGCIQIFHKVSKVAVDQLNHQRLKHHLALDEVSIACTNASTAYTYEPYQVTRSFHAGV